jgi:hypothetical protein
MFNGPRCSDTKGRLFGFNHYFFNAPQMAIAGSERLVVRWGLKSKRFCPRLQGTTRGFSLKRASFAAQRKH